jgi:hypothetical protein
MSLSALVTETDRLLAEKDGLLPEIGDCRGLIPDLKSRFENLGSVTRSQLGPGEKRN